MDEEIIDFDNDEDEAVFTPKKPDPEEEPYLEYDEDENSSPDKTKLATHIATIVAIVLLIVVPVIIIMSIKSGKNTEETDDLTPVITEVTTESVSTGDTEVTGSTRFKSLDDLTYYIENFTGYYYSLEKQLYTRYENGDITRDEMVEQITGYTEEINTVYHLLTVNKSVYEENNMTDTYEGLNEGINELIIYGDIIIYGE